MNIFSIFLLAISVCFLQCSTEISALSYNENAYHMIQYDPDSVHSQVSNTVQIAIIDVGVVQDELLSFEQLRESVSGDTEHHGAIVAHLLASRTDTNIKFEGLMPGVSLYGFSLSEEECAADHLAMAIDTVSEWNVDIISISLGTKVESENLKRAVLNATNQGIVLVCSAGNIPYTKNFPASFDIEGLISVGAVGNNFDILDYTNGSLNIDIFAPGEGISSIQNIHDSVSRYSGTSVAVPFVTFACALVKAYAPNLTPAEVEKILVENSYQYSGRWRNQNREIKLIDIKQLLHTLAEGKM